MSQHLFPFFLPLHKTFIPINKERLSPHCLFSNDAQCNNVQTLIVKPLKGMSYVTDYHPQLKTQDEEL
jgi:hypothetical protein